MRFWNALKYPVKSIKDQSWRIYCESEFSPMVGYDLEKVTANSFTRTKKQRIRDETRVKNKPNNASRNGSVSG